MPAYPSLAADDASGLHAVIATARQSVDPTPLPVGVVYAVRDSSGGTTTIDLTGDKYRDTPARKAGTTKVWDAPSFTGYFTKHSDPASDVFADPERLTITGVLDADTKDGARWAQHRVVLELRKTKAWQAWSTLDGQLMDQERFAEFLEDHLAELVSPPAAEMLEIAQSLQAASKVDFKSSVRLATGQRQLAYEETTTAKAGQKGQLTIPETFEIGLVPFEGSAPYRLTARFRYRINGGALQLAFRLDRPEDTLRAAFGDVVESVQESMQPLIMTGSPASR
jgi:uncharacterized protein YfdQ (DUF2303 family)